MGWPGCSTFSNPQEKPTCPHQGSLYFSNKDKALGGKTLIHNSQRTDLPYLKRLQPLVATSQPSATRSQKGAVTQVLPNTSHHHFPYTIFSKSLVALLVTTQEALSTTSTKTKEKQGLLRKRRASGFLKTTAITPPAT